MSNYNWAEYPQPLYGHADLEVLQHQTQLQNPQPVAQITAPPPHIQEKPSPTICGLPKKVLCLLIIIAIVVILSGIGGGLAARFAGQHKQESKTQGPGRESVQTLSSTFGLPTTTELTKSTAPEILITTIQTVVSQSLILSSSPSSNPCSTTSAFTTGLWWMGTQNHDSVFPVQLLWYYELNSAQRCCERCFSLSNTGPNGQCNVWGYFPLPYGSYANHRDSCAIIWGYEGDNRDAVCPAGRPNIGLLEPTGQQVKDANGIGAPGLCAGSIYTYTTAGQ